MSGGMISNKPVLKRLGTPADTDVSTDILNLDGKADTISTAVVTDIPATITTLDGKADTISTAVVTDIPATLGTPTGADIATDLANIQTEVDKIGTPADTDVSTDLANIQTEVDKIGTPANSTVSQDIADTLTAVNAITGFVPYPRVIYVDAAAVGSNNGTSWADAYTSLETAATALTDYTTILIAPGVYNCNSTNDGFSITESNVNIIAAGELGSVIIKNTKAGGTAVITLGTGSYQCFKNISVESSNSTYGIYNKTGTYNFFLNCEVHATGASTYMIYNTAMYSVFENIYLNCYSTLTGFIMPGERQYWKNVTTMIGGTATVGINSTTGTDYSAFSDIKISGCTTGITLVSGANSNTFNNITFSRVGTNISDSGTSNSFSNINDSSSLTAGNSIQQDVDAVYDDTKYLYTTALDGSEVENSIGKKVSDILDDTGTTLPALIASSGFKPYAKTVYIDVNATGDNNGTSWTNAYTTYMAAFAAATNNTLFLIAPGEYSSGESASVQVLAASYCTVKAAQGLGTVMLYDGNSSSANWILKVSGSYNRIEDLKFKPKKYSSWGTSRTIVNAGSYNIYNNLTSTGVSEGRIFSTDTDKNIIMNCWFELSGDTCTSGYGFIEFDTNSDDNICYNCHVKCTDTSQTKSIGFDLGSLSKRNMFINCSATNFFKGFSFSSNAGCTDNTILNCSFSNNATDYTLTNDNTAVGCNVTSKIVAGNNPQDDSLAIYNDSKYVKTTAISGATAGSVADNVQYLKTTAISSPTANSIADNVQYIYNTAVGSPKANSIADKIDILTASAERIVSRNAATVPDTTATPYFTVTGRVLIKQIVGEVTTVMDATATDIKLISNPTVGADVDLCVAVAIAEDAVGTLYTITGTLTDAMIATTSGAVKAQANDILVTAGTIDLHSSATQTGATKWTVHYIPLDSGSTVVTA